MTEHNILQKIAKEYLERNNWVVVENVEHKKTRSPGIFDLQAFKNGRAIFFEIKVDRDKLRKTQITFISNLEIAKIKYYVIRSINELMDLLPEIEGCYD